MRQNILFFSPENSRGHKLFVHSMQNMFFFITEDAILIF